ncbi:hypothetical protein PRIPAC_97654 [Pristionchus pacificus]|uniref:Uncharacterized protein n=1 Tax=Pristionchus pacificus TaxID=54126 RepID=A0A2A6BCD7_PRIPA|nr:hypothetical protein PRIPAC_97654 [Pristionchus pacificus]|eukprot:PDM63537.1 hypothetical protein PRIPAC_53894 [Pristionchus pacificus]
MFLLLLLLLHSSSADILSDHLTHNVDLNVHPCDNFYLHVCSQSVDEEQFPFQKIKQFYENITEEHRRNDIAILQNAAHDKPKFNKTLFTSLIQSRCSKDDKCYRKEFTYFYKQIIRLPGKVDRLKHWFTKIEKYKRKSIMKVLIRMIDSVHSRFHEFGFVKYDARNFYTGLTNRLFLMEDLKRRGVFEELENMNADILSLKELRHSEKLRGCIRKTNSNSKTKFKIWSTGLEVLDILFALTEADRLIDEISDLEEVMLLQRIDQRYKVNAFYMPQLNRIIILAPFIYPKLTDVASFDKPYDLFVTIAHEIFHSKSCNSGPQTFEEDGPDIEGLRIAFDWFLHSYDDEELKKRNI